jgi:hypothetical protein
VDETGWRLSGQPAWLHAWVSEQPTCYALDRQRSAEVLHDLFFDFCVNIYRLPVRGPARSGA